MVAVLLGAGYAFKSLYAPVFLALFGGAWFVYRWRAGGRAAYLLLSCVDLLLVSPVISWTSRSPGSGFPVLATALYGYGVVCAWALLTRKQLPDWVLPLRGTWARMVLATSTLIALLWDLVGQTLDLGPRYDAYGFVAVVITVLIAYWYPLWWALVHGWKLLKEWEAG